MPKKSTKPKVVSETLTPQHHKRRWSHMVPALSFLLLIFAISLAIYMRYFAYTLTYDANKVASDVSYGTASSGSTSSNPGVAAPEVKTGSSSVSTDPLVIKTGTFTITVKSASGAVQQITDIAAKMKGSVVSSTISESNTSCSGGMMPMYSADIKVYPSYLCYDAVMTIRVPATSYVDTRTAIQKVDENAKFDTETTQEVDVTTQASDLQAQLDSYKSEQTSLQKLLTNATAVDDILKIRSELTQVDAQVQSLTQQIRDLNKNVQYSQLTVSIAKVGSESQVSVPSVSARFAAAWAAMKQDLSAMGTALIFVAVYAVIYIPVLVLVFIIVWLIKRAVHRATKKR